MGRGVTGQAAKVIRLPVVPDPDPDNLEPTIAVQLVRARLRAEAKVTGIDAGERAATISGVLRRDEKDAGVLLPDPAGRPRTRAECEHSQRPCPWAGCRHHLYLDVTDEAAMGSIKLNFPTLEIEDLAETCALDVAAKGGVTLEAAAGYINLTRERLRQIESAALHKSRSSAEANGVTSESCED